MSNTTSTNADPSLSWPNVRVTSSTSIQTIVTSSLLHLANPLSAPLILHTLPSPSNSSNGTAIIAKNSHAGLCKLISIVEIIKREFEGHQKEAWRVEDEKLAKRLAKKNDKIGKSAKKGKKRARDEDEVEQAAEQAEQERPVSDAQPEADEAVASTSKDTSIATKESTKDKKKQRPLLRVYQYNILDAYERLPGASTSHDDNSRPDGASSSSECEDDEDDDDEAIESSKIEADLVKSKIKAAKSLDEAIQTHVIRAKKRPKKKHTPYMRIILSTRKLSEYETYLRSGDNKGPKDYTIQLPLAKTSRSRTPKKRKNKKVDNDGEVEEGEVVQGNYLTAENEGNSTKATKDNTTTSTTVQAVTIAAETMSAESSSNKKSKSDSKKRKADEMDTQSTEATQKSSQIS